MTSPAEQLGLFADQQRRIPYKHVVLIRDGDEPTTVEWGPKEIFDTERFSKLRAVTYSATARFVNTYLTGFADIEIVIGAAETTIAANVAGVAAAKEAQRSISEALEWEAGAGLFHMNAATSLSLLDKAMQQAVAAGTFKVLKPVGSVVHSKFYLMEGKSGKRLVIGSANLSEQAFVANRPQYEELIVVEDDALYALYERRYQEDIKPTTEPFYAKETIEWVLRPTKDNKKRKDKEQGSIPVEVEVAEQQIAPIEVTREIAEQTAQKGAVRLIQDFIPRQIDEGNIPEETLDSLIAAKPLSRKERAAWENEADTYDLVAKLVKETTTRDSQSGRATLKNPAAIKKAAEKLIHLRVPDKASDVDAEDSMPPLVLRPQQRDVKNGITGLFKVEDLVDQDSAGDVHLEPYGNEATPEQLTAALGKLDDFMQSYASFALNYDDEYGKRLMEAVLFAFQAPYMPEVRWRVAPTKDQRYNVPDFLVLGATAGSGKTTLLSAISRLLWDADVTITWPRAIDGATRQPRKNSQIIGLLKAGSGYLDGTFPLLVDEVDPSFFQKENDAEKLIKDVVNELAEDEKSQLACFICTTNATDSGGSTGVSLDKAARRRSYYLLIDKPIDTRAEGYRDSVPVADLVAALDSTLSRDFDLRMARALEDEQTQWQRWDERSGKFDFLCVARDIFLAWYEECGIEVPAYFPRGLVEDFDAVSRDKWNKIWRLEPELFKWQEEKESLLFDVDYFKDASAFRGDVSVREYRQALPEDVCVDGARGKGGRVIELKADAFCKWIGVDNPYKKKRGFFARLRHRLRG